MAGSPYSYALEGVTPIDPNAFGAGLNVGTNLIEGNRAGVMFDQAQQDRQVAIATATAAAKRQADFRARAAEIAKDPSSERLQSLGIEFPEYVKEVKQSFDALSPVEQQTRFDILNGVDLMLTNGHSEQAKQYIENEAKAFDEKSPQQARSMRALAAMIAEDPTGARVRIGSSLAAIDPKYVENRKGLLTEDADVASAAAEARKKTADAEVSEVAALHADEKALLDLGKTQAEIDETMARTKDLASRYGLEWAKLRQDAAQEKAKLDAAAGIIPPKVQSMMDDAADTATASRLSSQKSKSLAAKFRAQKDMLWNKGIDATIGEGLNSLSGRNGVLTAARKDFVANREALVALALKGAGSATENERSAFRAGMPDPNGDPVVVADWLDRAALALDNTAKIDSFKAEWISANKGLNPARGSQMVGDAEVAEGTPYSVALEAYNASLPNPFDEASQ